MSCLICKSENLYPSHILTIEERRGVLEDVQNFVLCKGCGNVMMKNTRGDIVSTDHIRDTNIIKLAYQKLFGSSFKGTPPSQYGFTKDGERFSTKDLNTALAIKNEEGLTYLQETPAPVEQPIDREQLDKYVEEAKTVDNAAEKTYPHVDNSNVRVGFFGKIKKFVKNLFSKAS